MYCLLRGTIVDATTHPLILALLLLSTTTALYRLFLSPLLPYIPDYNLDLLPLSLHISRFMYRTNMLQLTCYFSMICCGYGYINSVVYSLIRSRHIHQV